MTAQISVTGAGLTRRWFPPHRSNADYMALHMPNFRLIEGQLWIRVAESENDA